MGNNDLHVVEKSEKVFVEARTFGNEDGKKVMGFVPIDPKTLQVTPDSDIAFNGEVIWGL